MFHSSLRIHFLFSHEHLKTMFLKLFQCLDTIIKYLLRNIRQETSESKVNGVKDS